ncbi:MAG: hypothetical protein U0T33_07465 [Bacteroidales bacterium]
MGPDRTNYEIWFIDYLDGKLDEEGCRLLMAFLDKNPDLKEELADIRNFQISPSELVFSGKDGLKHDVSAISDQQFDLLCAASAENDLDENQEAELRQIIESSPARKKTYELFRNLKLSPPAATYKYKSRLKRLTPFQKTGRLVLISLSAAATIALALIVLNPSDQSAVYTNIASAEKQAAGANTVNTTTAQVRPEITSATNKVKEEIKITTTKKNEPVVLKLAVETLPALPDSADTVITNFPKIEIEKIAFLDNEFSIDKNGAQLAYVEPVYVDNTFDQDDNGPGMFLERLFREKVFKMNGRKRPDAYDIADAGIRKINNFFGWNMSLRKNRNDKGEVRSVTFTSKLLTFDTPVKK